MSNDSKGGMSALEFSLRFSNVDHLSVHSCPSAWHCHVGFHLFFVRTGTKQVKEETLADPNTTPTKQLRQSVSVISQRSVQIRLQKGSSSRCRLSRPSTQLPIQRHEPVPCVQVLFRVVAPGARTSPKTFPSVLCGVLVQKPVCDAMPTVAFVRRLSWMCGVG